MYGPTASCADGAGWSDPMALWRYGRGKSDGNGNCWRCIACIAVVELGWFAFFLENQAAMVGIFLGETVNDREGICTAP